MKRWLVSGTSVKEQVMSKGVFPSLSKLGYGLLSRYTGWRKHHQLPSEALKLGAFWQGYGGQTQLPKKGKRIPSFFPPASTKPISGWGSPGQESRWPPTPTLPLIRADTFSDTWVCSARVKWLDACDLPARCRVSRWASTCLWWAASIKNLWNAISVSACQFCCHWEVSEGRATEQRCLHFASITWLLVLGYTTLRRLMNNTDKTVF